MYLASPDNYLGQKKNLYSVKKKLFFSKGIHFMGTTVAAIMVGTSKTIISKKKRENST